MANFSPGDIVKNPSLHPDLRFKVVGTRGGVTDVVVCAGTFYDVYGTMGVIQGRVDGFRTDKLFLDFEAMCREAIQSEK